MWHVAGELVEAVGAWLLTDGITATRFPQPGQLKGTLGAQLENGHLFFSHAELRRFWAEEAASEALSETDSLLAADEEGLEHLQVRSATSVPLSLATPIPIYGIQYTYLYLCIVYVCCARHEP